jgi:undecaprenyl-diphosphatase
MVCRGTASRVVATVLGILFVAVTGWSRLYVGAHYPTDIVGGVLAGAAGALLVAWLWNVCARSLLPRFERDAPQ